MRLVLVYRRRRVARWLVGIFIVIVIVEYAIFLSAGTIQFSAATSLLAEEHPAKLRLIQRLDTVKIVSVFVVFLYMIVLHAYRASKSGWFWLRRGDCKPRVNHWTSAASHGIFTEFAKSVTWAHCAVVVSYVTVTLLSSLPLLLRLNTQQTQSELTIDFQEYATQQCGPSLFSSCSLGATSLLIAPRLRSGMVVTFMATVISTPIQFWSPVFLEAARKQNNIRLQRCIRWLLPVTFGLLLWSSHLLSFAFLYLFKEKGGSAAFSHFFFTSVALFAFQLAALCYFSGVTWPSCLKRNTSVMPLTTREGMPSDLEWGGSARLQADSAELTHHQTGRRSGCLLKMHFDPSPGRRYYTDLLAWLSIFLWATPDLSGVLDGKSVLVMWALRASAALLYLC
eukprot:scaffold98790_cov33-Prasinocladus_malaysianus.AAC.1